MFELQNLTLGYVDKPPVGRHWQAKIPQGNVTVIVGCNGSGKSTLIKTLARLQAPIAGRVLLGGRDIKEFSPDELAHKVALLPQQVNTDVPYTVRQLVGLGRYPYRHVCTKAQDKIAIEDAMQTAGVHAWADRLVRDLSGGEQQRCWIALLLSQETPVLLLDEPTASLDLQFQGEVLQLLRNIAQKKGKTVVMVLHDLNRAAKAADHLLVLHEQKIYAQGTPEAILTTDLIHTVFRVEAQRVEHFKSAQFLFH